MPFPKPALRAKAFEIDAPVEAQTEEETFFDYCQRGDWRHRMRRAIHVGVKRVGGGEADGLVTVVPLTSGGKHRVGIDAEA